MSDVITTEKNTPHLTGRDVEPALPALRVWPAVVLLAVFWVFLYANHNIDMSMFGRFISRMVAFGLLLLVFLTWWITRRAVAWRDRLLALVVVIGVGIVAALVADKSMSAFVLFMSAFPIVFTVWTAWLIVARPLSPALQRAGYCAVMILSFGYFALLRWDGLDAAQRTEMSWRWQPTKEQQFLSSREAAAAQDVPPPIGDAKPWQIQPGDWPEFRGPERVGIVRGVRLQADWNTRPPKLLWRQRLGPGWSGLIEVDGHLVTQEQRGDLEAVVAYDANTGQEIWAHEDALRFEESLSGAGPRGTPIFAAGRIYALGAKGKLNCLDAVTGKLVWSNDIVTDAEVAADEMPVWGYSVSPLVVDDVVIVFAGGTHDKSLLAYRADDGKLAWTSPGGKQSYSSPQFMQFDDHRQLVMQDNHALTGRDIANGRVLWERVAESELAVPMLQPHQTDSGDVVISEEADAALLEIKHNGDRWTVASRWTSQKFRPGFNDFVIHKGHLYGLDDGILCCFDMVTGKRLWKKGRFGHGQMLLLADQDALLLSSDMGAIALVAISPEGYEELGRFQAIDGKTWNGPVLVGDRLYLRNGAEMAAYEVRLEGAQPTDVAGR